MRHSRPASWLLARFRRQAFAAQLGRIAPVRILGAGHVVVVLIRPLAVLSPFRLGDLGGLLGLSSRHPSLPANCPRDGVMVHFRSGLALWSPAFARQQAQGPHSMPSFDMLT